MTSELAAKYDRRVPRYTSYPTAPHFTPNVDGVMYRRWLGELDPSLDLSLYFHIPFCETICWFCGCHTQATRRYGPIEEYLSSLLAEIDLIADALPGRFGARHLHWGGGSPTMLKGQDWQSMFERLTDRFDLADVAEIAVELDPRTTSEDYIVTLAANGVNRASIGVQDFHPEVQEAINRIQPFEVTERLVAWLRDHGIGAINMDLMYGLPFQTAERVSDMVDRAVGLRPSRIALFGYAHVPWMCSRQKMIDTSALPDSRERWTQINAASERLAEHGYLPIGLDHFAHPDDSLVTAVRDDSLRRNFQGYTTDEAPVLLGFGSSAIGTLPRGHVQNELPLKAYSDAIAKGLLPVARGIAFGGEDRMRRDVINRLMCGLGADVGQICRRHEVDSGTLDCDIARLAPYAEDGIVDLKDRRIEITPAGRPFVRLVAAEFDTYLHRNPARHSNSL